VDGHADVTVDVAIVGGGIAGAALATVLAREGYEVLLLERQTSYRDKVRGEFLSCWGVAEMLALDLEKPFLDAGGHYIRRFVPYDEVIEPGLAEANAVPLNRLLPGVPGCLDVGHPQACETLARAATEAGATVLRGVGDVDVAPGEPPMVRYELDDLVTTVSAGLVVGADGRTSSVRRQLKLTLHETRIRSLLGGMLVDGLEAWPVDQIRWAPRGTSSTSCSRGRTGGRASTCCTTSPSAAASPGRTGTTRSWTPSDSAACRTPTSSAPPVRPARARSTR
jgi:2-polyprenyl-6-methoxyphenol hydroxylase-like FAD-dependent oxidoreductase